MSAQKEAANGDCCAVDTHYPNWHNSGGCGVIGIGFLDKAQSRCPISCCASRRTSGFRASDRHDVRPKSLSYIAYGVNSASFHGTNCPLWSLVFGFGRVIGRRAVPCAGLGPQDVRPHEPRLRHGCPRRQGRAQLPVAEYLPGRRPYRVGQGKLRLHDARSAHRNHQELEKSRSRRPCQYGELPGPKGRDRDGRSSTSRSRPKCSL